MEVFGWRPTDAVATLTLVGDLNWEGDQRFTRIREAVNRAFAEAKEHKDRRRRSAPRIPQDTQVVVHHQALNEKIGPLDSPYLGPMLVVVDSDEDNPNVIVRWKGADRKIHKESIKIVEDTVDTGDYEVEAITGVRRRKGKTLEFRIKWKGYDEETWEAPKELTCVHLLTDFLEHYEGRYKKMALEALAQMRKRQKFDDN